MEVALEGRGGSGDLYTERTASLLQGLKGECCPVEAPVVCPEPNGAAMAKVEKLVEDLGKVSCDCSSVLPPSPGASGHKGTAKEPCEETGQEDFLVGVALSLALVLLISFAVNIVQWRRGIAGAPVQKQATRPMRPPGPPSAARTASTTTPTLTRSSAAATCGSSGFRTVELGDSERASDVSLTLSNVLRVRTLKPSLVSIH
jgi:hypothetical protein